MAERSVHESAVEAMKLATCVCETGINGRHWNACPAPAIPKALAALVAGRGAGGAGGGAAVRR